LPAESWAKARRRIGIPPGPESRRRWKRRQYVVNKGQTKFEDSGAGLRPVLSDLIVEKCRQTRKFSQTQHRAHPPHSSVQTSYSDSNHILLSVNYLEDVAQLIWGSIRRAQERMVERDDRPRPRATKGHTEVPDDVKEDQFECYKPLYSSESRFDESTMIWGV
jgi:hypothetical protein